MNIVEPSSDDLAMEAGMCRRLKESDSCAVSNVHLLDRSGIPSVLKGKTCLQTTVRPCPFFHWNTLPHVHNSNWRFLWRQESSANLAPSLWQRQLAFPLCSKALYFRDAVKSSSSHFPLTPGQHALITLHWTTHLLDRAWLIKSFADPIKWRKKKSTHKHERSVCFTFHRPRIVSRCKIL